MPMMNGFFRLYYIPGTFAEHTSSVDRQHNREIFACQINAKALIGLPDKKNVRQFLARPDKDV